VTDQPGLTLDLAVLAALSASVGDDDAFVADLVETYLDDGATQLEGIGQAVKAGDAEALVRPAHTLKSASLTVGAARLGEISRGLEQLGRSGTTAGAGDLAADARAEWEGVVPALRSWLAERVG
jgi:two-component system, sensor histidine kinase and response regulator